jgi:uncharacterized protein YaaR (DUF327 family)
LKIKNTTKKTRGLFSDSIRKTETKSEGETKVEFAKSLDRVREKNSKEELESIIGGIIEKGDMLAKKIDIRTLKEYKRLIARFLDIAVSGSLKFSKESFLDRRGRHRVYANVKKINRELELLTEEVIGGEANNISVLKRIEEIKGLVLDFKL